MEYSVILKDGTIGAVDTDTLDGQSPEVFVGEIINVHLYDENGNETEVRGELVEVLD